MRIWWANWATCGPWHQAVLALPQTLSSLQHPIPSMQFQKGTPSLFFSFFASTKAHFSTRSLKIPSAVAMHQFARLLFFALSSRIFYPLISFLFFIFLCVSLSGESAVQDTDWPHQLSSLSLTFSLCAPFQFRQFLPCSIAQFGMALQKTNPIPLMLIIPQDSELSPISVCSQNTKHLFSQSPSSPSMPESIWIKTSSPKGQKDRIELLHNWAFGKRVLFACLMQMFLGHFCKRHSGCQLKSRAQWFATVTASTKSRETSFNILVMTSTAFAFVLKC